VGNANEHTKANKKKDKCMNALFFKREPGMKIVREEFTIPGSLYSIYLYIFNFKDRS